MKPLRGDVLDCAKRAYPINLHYQGYRRRHSSTVGRGSLALVRTGWPTGLWRGPPTEHGATATKHCAQPCFCAPYQDHAGYFLPCP
jgi:hypothetical protein